MKYRICRRYSPLAGTWYVIQKRRLFGWHTLNMCFDKLHMANQYLDEVNIPDYLCETPMKWSKKRKRFYEEYPCETNQIRVR